MFRDVPANPMTAAQQYFDEKDEREGNYDHKTMIGRAVDKFENCVESALDHAAAACTGTDEHNHKVSRSEEVLPNPDQLQGRVPSPYKVEEMEREFLQGTAPTEFDDYTLAQQEEKEEE
ncbi:hypothetical protein AAVH_13932 [Aphelenchoides avenae]|nr:hypothetical protein AAVH_13932 [Aphelenchus avenae]